MLASSGYGTVAILILVVIGMSGGMLLLTHLIGPKRHGPVKDSTYESGMTPVTSARQRINVRFYLVAVMYVIFGVEVVFLYPWAVVFPHLRAGLTEYQAAEAASAAGESVTLSQAAEQAGRLAELGYGPGFVFVAISIFFLLLLVGFAYEWRKGVFRWD